MITRYVSRVLFAALLCISMMHSVFGLKKTPAGVKREIKNVAIILNRSWQHALNPEDAIVGEMVACFEKDDACMVVDGMSLSLFMQKIWHVDDFFKTLPTYNHAFYMALKINAIFKQDAIDFFKNGWDVYHIKNTIFFVCVPLIYCTISERFKKSNSFSLVLDHTNLKAHEETKECFETKIRNIVKEEKILSNNLAKAFTLFMDLSAHAKSADFEEQWTIVLEGHGNGIMQIIADLNPQELQEFLAIVNSYHIAKKWRTHMLFCSSCHIGGENQKFFHNLIDAKGNVLSKKTYGFPIILSCSDDLVVTFPFLKVPKCPDFFEQAQAFKPSNKNSVKKFLTYCSHLNPDYEMSFCKKYHDKHQRCSIPLVSLAGTNCFSLYPLTSIVSVIDKNDVLTPEEMVVKNVKMVGIPSHALKKPLRIEPVMSKRVPELGLAWCKEKFLAPSLVEYVLGADNQTKIKMASAMKDTIVSRVCLSESEYDAWLDFQYPAAVFCGDWCSKLSRFYFEKITVAGVKNDTKKLGPVIQFIRDSFCDVSGFFQEKVIWIKELACGAEELLGLLLIDEYNKIEEKKTFEHKNLKDFLHDKENIVLRNVMICVKSKGQVVILFSCAGTVNGCWKTEDAWKWSFVPVVNNREGGKVYTVEAFEKDFDGVKERLLSKELATSEDLLKESQDDSSPFLSSFTGGCIIQ